MKEDEFEKEKKIIAMNSVNKEENKIDWKPFEDLVTLKSIDITVRKGDLVAIIGEVGSGKSSVMSALIGDMIHVDSDTLSIYKWNEISS